jgi:serine/threonine-protein kinase
VALFVVLLGDGGGITSLVESQEETEFERYQLLRTLRTNDFATVHLADDPVDDRQVALKVLNPPFHEDGDLVRTFLSEGRVLQRIREKEPDAPVIGAYRIGHENEEEQSGRPFIAMELVQGSRLDAHLKGEGVLAVRDALGIMHQVCTGLRIIHDHHFWHGALTPENVIITRARPEFEVKLAGFGVEKRRYMESLSDQAPRQLTSYIAPEQLEEGEGGYQSDMYAAGMLFYTMVTGVPLLTSNGDATPKVQEQGWDPHTGFPDHVPSHIKPIFNRMVDNNPGRRPTASEAASILNLMQATT